MSIDLKKIATENRNPNTLDIDRVSTLEMVQKINNEDKKIAIAIEKELPHIAAAIDIIVDKLSKGGRLIYAGAGTSGRLGILDASECPPTYGVSPELVQGVIAGGMEAVFKSVEGAEDSKEMAVADLKNLNFSAKDVLVGIAASGRTPYVIGALEYANGLNAETIAIANSKNSPIGNTAKIKIEVEVDAEVITGSTRMKAGSAQKMILNMLSTGTMVKLGKVYSNLMVDVQALNAKLVERCKKIFMEATGADYATAEEYLNNSKYNVKAAILMYESKLNFEDSLELLATHNGVLYNAIRNGEK
ncbi:MAG: N-acetylmuramic acid 6-phosphate etherase [Alphaproteobacteria bacterium]|jgi:N-acetylmuramic acid 6-phosphate etherase|nr:N-acetylmuramic acid 6-phosphate etherase [Alphaproteobacteria bacterium]